MNTPKRLLIQTSIVNYYKFLSLFPIAALQIQQNYCEVGNFSLVYGLTVSRKCYISLT